MCAVLPLRGQPGHFGLEPTKSINSTLANIRWPPQLKHRACLSAWHLRMHRICLRLEARNLYAFSYQWMRPQLHGGGNSYCTALYAVCAECVALGDTKLGMYPVEFPTVLYLHYGAMLEVKQCGQVHTFCLLFQGAPFRQPLAAHVPPVFLTFNNAICVYVHAVLRQNEAKIHDCY